MTQKSISSKLIAILTIGMHFSEQNCGACLLVLIFSGAHLLPLITMTGIPEGYNVLEISSTTTESDFDQLPIKMDQRDIAIILKRVEGKQEKMFCFS